MVDCDEREINAIEALFPGKINWYDKTYIVIKMNPEQPKKVMLEHISKNVIFNILVCIHFNVFQIF